LLPASEYAEILDTLIEDVNRDYVGLWVIPWLIERFAPYTRLEDVKPITLRLVAELLRRGQARAGGLTGSGQEFIEWDLPVEAIIDRIDTAWTQLGRTPNIGEVVWFDRIR
jgi:hypothetical protein